MRGAKEDSAQAAAAGDDAEGQGTAADVWLRTNLQRCWCATLVLGHCTRDANNNNNTI